MELGGELANSEDLFSKLLPAIFNPETDSLGLTYLGAGFAQSCKNPIWAWKLICTEFKRHLEDLRYSGFISGFLRGLYETEPTVANDIAHMLIADGELRRHAILLLVDCDQRIDGHKRLIDYLAANLDVAWPCTMFPRNPVYDIEENCVELIDAIWKRNDSIDIIMEMILSKASESYTCMWSNFKKKVFSMLAEYPFETQELTDDTIGRMSETIDYA